MLIFNVVAWVIGVGFDGSFILNPFRGEAVRGTLGRFKRGHCGVSARGLWFFTGMRVFRRGPMFLLGAVLEVCSYGEGGETAPSPAPSTWLRLLYTRYPKGLEWEVQQFGRKASKPKAKASKVWEQGLTCCTYE